VSWLFPCRIIKEALRSLQYAILVKYFGDKEWSFHDTNIRSLLDKLTPEDSAIFNFDIKQINWTEYLENCVKGVRQYVLKDDFSTLPKARKRYKM
jgi:fatty acyl-CoA reductase